MNNLGAIWVTILSIAFNAVEDNKRNKWWKDTPELWGAWTQLKLNTLVMVEDDRFTLNEIWRCYEDAKEFDKMLKEYQPTPPPPPPSPYEWVKGIVTLNPIPTAKEIKEMGFNLLFPFGHVYNNQKAFIKEYARLGGKVIMPVDADVSVPLDSILGYSLMDQPDCRKVSIADMEKSLEDARAFTEKPIGCGFCGPDIGCGYGQKKEWIKFINKLDFVLLTAYPYRAKIILPLEELKRMTDKEWKDIKVPIIPYSQAIWGDYGHTVFTKPDIKEQLDFWREEGYGNIAYTWNDGKGSGVKFDKERWEKELK